MFEERVAPLIFDTTDTDAVAIASQQVCEIPENGPLFGIVNDTVAGNTAIADAWLRLHPKYSQYQGEFFRYICRVVNVELRGQGKATLQIRPMKSGIPR